MRMTSAIHPDNDCPELHLADEPFPCAQLPIGREELRQLEAALREIDRAHYATTPTDRTAGTTAARHTAGAVASGSGPAGESTP